VTIGIKSELKIKAMAVITNVSKETKQLNGIKELAEFLEISLPTARKLKNSGKIPFIQIGKKIIFNSAEVIQGIRHMPVI